MVKRLLAGLLLIVLLPLSAARAETAAVDGDLNGDGAVTAMDAAVALHASLGLLAIDNAQASRADVTGNLVVDAADVLMLLYQRTGLLASFAEIGGEPSSGLGGESDMAFYSYNGVRQGETYYRSHDVAVTVLRETVDGTVVFTADIHVRDVESLRVGVQKDYGSPSLGKVESLAARYGAIVAVSGDHAAALNFGFLIRNGQIVQSTMSRTLDLCALGYDGVLRCYPVNTVTKEEILADDPYQTWVAGPILIQNGEIVHAFDGKTLTDAAQRSAIGCYAPGHYCFIVADGRQAGYSVGLSAATLAEYILSLGCRDAFLLNGSRAAVMADAEGLISNPRAELSSISDIIYVTEPPAHGISDTDPD